jgi:hypothetical protein
MKNIRLFALLLFILAGSFPALAQAGNSDGIKTVTLYSPLYPHFSHHKPRPRLCLDFDTGKLTSARGDQWDICYGYIYHGNDLDWLEVVGTNETRTVIKDLGVHDWNEPLKVSTLKPLPELKPGERRNLTISFSGKDGRGDLAMFDTGREFSVYTSGTNRTNRDHSASMNPYQILPERIGRGPLRADGHGVDADEGVEWIRTIPLDSGENPPRRKQHKDPPVLAQAALDHVYEIHVVNERDDYYVLLRVDALTRGDNCTVSWKRVPSPH